MTKYILHGGAWQPSYDYKNFFTEMTGGLSGPINVLCVYYARDKETWDDRFAEDKIKFTTSSSEKVMNFEMAKNETEDFIEQIKWADLIYMRGGDSHVLQGYLEKISNLENLWGGKVIAGSSAGALVLSKYYYENDDDSFNKGLGILPIKAICHYTDEIADKLEQLKMFGEPVDTVYAIPEKSFVVVRQ